MDQNEVNNSINSDLIRGHIDTIILKALQAGDRYGYDIIKEIEHKSDGQYVIKQPTLYSCLKRLEVQGFVKSYWGSKSIGGRKKYFTLTDMGKELFLKNKNDWDYSRDVINKLISDDDYSVNEQNEDGESESGEIIDNVQEMIDSPAGNSALNFVSKSDSIESEEESELDDIDNEDESEEESELDDIDDEEENEDEVDELPSEDEAESITSDNYVQSNNESIVESSDEVESETVEVFDDEQHAEYSAAPSANCADALDSEIINADNFVASTTTERISNEIDESNSELLQQDEFDSVDSLPLSVAEQNHNLDNSNLLEEENSELINQVYDEQTQESYINSVENTEYVPTQDDLIDVNDYFEDIEESYDDEDEVAAAVDVEPQKDVLNEESSPSIQKIYPSRKIIRDVPEKQETVFYSYKQPVKDIDEGSAIIDKEYRGVISKLISDNIVVSAPPIQNNDYSTRNYYSSEPKPTAEVNTTELRTEEPEQVAAFQREEDNVIETESGDTLSVRSHSNVAIRVYNNKHYYYANQLRLLQSGILFAIMLIEIVCCFYFIEVVHNELNVSNFTLALYILAVAVAAAFPIVSFFMASADYYKRKRINYSGKSNALFSIAATILLVLIIFFINVYGGILIGDINNYLSSLIMPMVLCTNVIVNNIIFHILYKSGKYNIEK